MSPLCFRGVNAAETIDLLGTLRHMRLLLAILRLAAAAAIVVAITAQWIESQNDPGYRFVNFFGYFTIQSNMFIAAAFIVLAVVGLSGREQPPWLTVAHAATITYIATTGIVYNLLLANGPLGDFNVAWSNNILHRVIPVFAVVQWILFGDRSPIRWSRLWYFLIYPVVWLIVILLRGQDFVPYPFLNVVQIGAGSVALYCVAITAFVVGMSALVIWTSRLRILRPSPGVPAQERASVSST
jgi:hypothetical protein